MSILDTLLVGAVLAVAAWWIVAPRLGRKLLQVAPIALVILAAVQSAIEGVYWQFFPAYLLIVVVAFLSVFRRNEVERPGKLTRLGGGAGLVALMLITAGPWMLLPPVPQLPAPDGSYAVGTQIFRWVDDSRAETLTEDPSDRRNVIVQAWYPAAPGAAVKRSIYMDGLHAPPADVAGIPSFFLKSYGAIDTSTELDAAISADKEQWPVVVFMTGYGGPRAVYTSLVRDLASRGYVVLALDHPYEAGITELADGRVVSTVQSYAADDPDGSNFIRGRLNLRVEDVVFVLNQLDRPGALGSRLSGHLDLGHIAAVGHSLGGAASAQAMERDQRIKAAANIDGFFHSSLSSEATQRPFLLIDSDHVVTAHTDRYFATHDLVFQYFGGGWHYELPGTNHYSFTDAPFFFAPLGRLVLAQLLGGNRDATDAHRATVTIVDAFLRGPLTGAPADIDAAASRYKDIKGGLVSPK